ncbi:hypothetical protein EDWATA_02771 [Edwardsiella tarda ATCC 23685]|uniref:Uncharacterized protein n=1 Tax=Edwardsiella tarda ATCC 23685 TaxID=500638 RepID=D4F7N5_EDWTA|nr:hypothetical protein EDWATA_02771 [Edwardsiella tarda ATCC 23685]
MGWHGSARTAPRAVNVWHESGRISRTTGISQASGGGCGTHFFND